MNPRLYCALVCAAVLAACNSASPAVPTLELSPATSILETAGSVKLTAKPSTNASAVELYDEAGNFVAKDDSAPFEFTLEYTSQNNGWNSYYAKAINGSSGFRSPPARVGVAILTTPAVSNTISTLSAQVQNWTTATTELQIEKANTFPIKSKQLEGTVSATGALTASLGAVQPDTDWFDPEIYTNCGHKTGKEGVAATLVLANTNRLQWANTANPAKAGDQFAQLVYHQQDFKLQGLCNNILFNVNAKAGWNFYIYTIKKTTGTSVALYEVISSDILPKTIKPQTF